MNMYSIHVVPVVEHNNRGVKACPLYKLIILQTLLWDIAPLF